MYMKSGYSGLNNPEYSSSDERMGKRILSKEMP
jgi:hypothetical protein